MLSLRSLFGRRDPRPFRAGQRLRYATRPGEERSRIVVLRVDEDATLGQIIHLAIENVDITPPGSARRMTRIGHVPISKAALRASRPELDEEALDVPAFQQGYDTWRAEFDAGRAGVFSIPIAEIVAVMAETLAQGS
ncbi:MAG TPA: hypothetical protein VJ276_24425 [Thermoanaerobaculia bacterium]|nr:hypothetical protein [Thermoanaerobaculia bacterium]